MVDESSEIIGMSIKVMLKPLIPLPTRRKRLRR
jgi:hypothetical protein